ncbi:uncharacterized protein LOC108625779 isoform X1 [Ceratina calcarata]|uniref:Uncharacterized protein LOC108625779 isoform X1 n=1 Tax=Ceratina calcarata TaxID=156304 RepID=A0AAJ7WBA0_9HYME|nr:uncharacterized protein LOC108625779 isoform X1 [Ceratina calcarata]
MGMVTLVQDYQHSTLDGNHQHQKDQHPESDIPAENRDSEIYGEILQVAKNTAIDVVRNGSLAGSSTQCSDVENDEDDETVADEEDWVPDLPVPTAFKQEVVSANGNLVLPNADTSNFGDVRVKNSTNVHLGNKTFYKGPVTIKQFVYTNPTIQDLDEVKIDNTRTSDTKTTDFLTKGDLPTNNSIFSQNSDKGNSAEATAKKIRSVYGEELITDRAVSDWFAKFRSGDTTSKDELSAGGPSDFDDDVVKTLLEQNLRQSTRATKWLWTWQCSAFLSVLALFFVTVVVIVSVYYARNSSTVTTPGYPQIPSSGSEEKPSKVRFVTRDEWGAQPAAEPLEPLKLPVPYVIISHTVTDFCTTQAECTFRVRFAQTFHIESRHWSDIAYNFLVGGDGLVYVGRGWNYVGAHSFGYNNKSIGISCIGTFNSLKPSKTQLYALELLIETGVELGKIAKDYKLLGHRQISQTLSPGEALYSELITWPHWSLNV